MKGLIIGTARAEELSVRLREEGMKGRNLQQADVLDPEVISGILHAWQLKPEECLGIVETKEAEQAARELGLPCIGYRNPELSEEELQAVDWVVEGFEEVDWEFLEEMYARTLGLPVEIARTEHLLIREMVPEDLDRIYEMYEDEACTRFLRGPEEDREEEMERLKSYIRYMYGICGYGMWTVIDRESGCIIGRAGYGVADYKETKETDLGYLIAREWRGRGLAKEACQAVLSYGYNRLGFTRVAAYIHEENEASLAVARSLGFHQTERVPAEGGYMLRLEKELTE